MTSITAPSAATPSLDRASRLLRLYPEISAEERGELVLFLKEGPPDDVARLTFGSGLDDRITALKKDHPGDFATGARMWAPFALFTLGAAALLLALHFLLG